MRRAITFHSQSSFIRRAYASRGSSGRINEQADGVVSTPAATAPQGTLSSICLLKIRYA
jgi:hypothetical protein